MNIYILLFEKIIALEDKLYPNRQDLLAQVMKYKRQFAKEHNLKEVPTNTALLQEYRQAIENGSFSRSTFLEKTLRKRSVRSESWIVPIQVLTKPFWCPGKCIFCPNDPTMPKSYIKSEPWAMRALMNQFDPHKQVYNRLLSLYRTGHNTDKIEMIVLWWTWDVYPRSYKENFLKGLYDACNTFEQFMKKLPELQKTEDDKIYTNLETGEEVTEDISKVDDDFLSEEAEIEKLPPVIGMPNFVVSDLGIEFPETIQESISINQTASHRVIGLTVETRPEYITDENCRMWREWGVTRLEVWLQSMFDDVLDVNKRWHSIQQAREGVHKMRQYWFKFSLHFMPGLYWSTVEKDIESFILAYSDPFIKPDEIKFYPTSVIPDTELFQLYMSGEYKPLANDDLVHIIKKVQHEIIPPYTRIKRLIRDIPSQEIAAWSDITNLRQITERQMLQENKNDPLLRKTLYARLYEDAHYYDNLEELVEGLKTDTTNMYSETMGDDIHTYIVWQPIDIDEMRNYIALDTRAREMRHRKDGNPLYIQLIVRKYLSSAWIELFLSFEDDLWYIYWFTRLLLPVESQTISWDGLGAKTALIRELHVYWDLAKIQSNAAKANAADTAQHKWLWTQLMDSAEYISKVFSYTKLSVISGIWVREYYKKLGYQLEGTYMVKDI